jgi:NTE family protein
VTAWQAGAGEPFGSGHSTLHLASGSWTPENTGPEEYGLALSGGGIRATLFHLGALWRINEMGWLKEIDRISGVSGGAIAAGLLAKAWSDLEWDVAGHATNFGEKYASQVLRLAGQRIDAPIVVLGLIPFASPARLLAGLLDRRFFRGMTLQDLPGLGEGPRFVFNATDLATGTDFRFERPYMGSWRVGLVRTPAIKVAVAVAASAAFPPIISPLLLRLDPAAVEDVKDADLHGRKDLLSRIALVDGGVYDNLGLEPITGRCHTYLVSDAGGNLGISPPGWKWSLWSLQVKRVLDIAVEQGRALRRRALADNKAAHPYALWRTQTAPGAMAQWVGVPFPVQEGWANYLSSIPTRLWPLPIQDRQRLVNWGYLTSDLALRAFVWKSAAPPTELPFPGAGFDGPPPRKPDIAGGS